MQELCYATGLFPPLIFLVYPAAALSISPAFPYQPPPCQGSLPSLLDDVHSYAKRCEAGRRPCPCYFGLYISTSIHSNTWKRDSILELSGHNSPAPAHRPRTPSNHLTAYGNTTQQHAPSNMAPQASAVNSDNLFIPVIVSSHKVSPSTLTNTPTS